MLHRMDKHPEPEEQAENIPPEAKTSKLTFQSTDVGQHFREENRPPLKTCACSTPATGERQSRLSGVLSTLSPIFRYFNFENKRSPPQSAPSSSCLKSAGKSAHHHSFHFSTLDSGTPLAATHRPYCLLDYECLPEMSLLDDTNNTTVQLTTNNSGYHQSGPPAAKPNAIVCPPPPPEAQKPKTIKLSEMKQSSVWNQMLDGNLPEITFLDDSSYLETTAGVQMASDGVVQDIMPDLALDKTQDMVQDKTQDVVQDKTQDVVQDKTRDLEKNLTQDMVQNLTQNMVQDLAQDAIDHVTQPSSDPSAETAPKFDLFNILTNKNSSRASVVTIKTSFEVTPDVTVNSTLKNNRSLEPNLQNTVKPHVSVDSGPVNRQNDTFALELLSGGDGCQREDPSQRVLHETMELSDGSIISSMDTSNANALIWDKSMDSVPGPSMSSTPMTNLKMLNLKSHRDEGQVPAAQKKLYQGGLSKPADQVPSDIPSNIVADRKTFLSQTGSKLLWVNSKAKSQLPKLSNPSIGVKSSIPRKPEPLQGNLPIKRQRIQNAVRKPAPPEDPQGITEKQSLSHSYTRTAVFKLPASGIQQPQMSKMTSLSKPASAVRRLPTRSNSQVLPRAGACESKDAVNQLSSTAANGRVLDQPAVRQRTLVTKSQKHGCANCSVLEEQLKLKTIENERLQKVLLQYTKKT